MTRKMFQNPSRWHEGSVIYVVSLEDKVFEDLGLNLLIFVRAVCLSRNN